MNIPPFRNKHFLLGVTGSIAAYKAADLASKLSQGGAQVTTILTKAGAHFVSPLTFQSVTSQPAYTDEDLWGAQAHVLHVGLAHNADVMILAPLTATTLSKLAQGNADNLLTLTALAFGPGKDKPLLLAPAMDAGMFSHPATQANLQTLEQRGATLIGPEEGHLASGLVAKGRMSEPLTILGHVRYQVSRRGPLAGKKVVVTAGGTQEALDPVRFLTNRSSGKQGYALAQAALDAGAEVTLITAPSHLAPPVGAETVAVRSSEEMLAATWSAVQNADALIMAAAVADFRPAHVADHKIKKSSQPLTLQLEPTVDILQEVTRRRATSEFPRFVVGFAAESQDVLANAQAKLESKSLDMIVVNDIRAPDAGFQVDTNRVTFLLPGAEPEHLPLMGKNEVAERVLQKVIDQLSPTPHEQLERAP